MKKTLTKMMAAAFAALGLSLAARAAGTTGDLYEIEKLIGDYGITSTYPTAGNPIEDGGQEIRFVLHLAATDADDPNVDPDVGDYANWYLDYIGSGSQAADDVMNPLRIGIVVSGRLQWATLIADYDNDSYEATRYDNDHVGSPGIHDLVFSYKTKPGDNAMPIRLALEGSTEEHPIAAFGASSKFMWQNADKWWFANKNGDSLNLSLVTSERRATMQEIESAFKGPSSDLTLAQAGFYVRTVNFVDADPSEWEQPDVYWRHVECNSGVTGLPAELTVNGTPSEKARLYAWTTNETVVSMSGGKATKMGMPWDDGLTTNTYKVATIEIVGGKSDGYLLPLWGESVSDTPVDVFVSQYDGFRYDASGYLVEDFLVTKVRCVEAPKPGVKISFDERMTEFTYNKGEAVVAPYDSAIETAIPIYVTLSDRKGLSADFEDGVDILLNPELVKDSTVDVFSNNYITVSLDPTVADEKRTSVHFDKGVDQVTAYLFVRGGDLKTATGIRFTPESTNDAFNAAYTGDRTSARINIRDAMPLLQLPEDGLSVTADAISGFDLNLQVLDCYRDMMSTNFTVSLGYTTVRNVEFARDITTKVHFISPGNSGEYKYSLTVTDPNGNTSTNKVGLTITVTPPKTVSCEFVADAEEGAESIRGTTYQENSNGTFSKVKDGTIYRPIPRFTLSDPNNSGATLYAFLVPLTEAASNYVSCAAFTEGVAIPLYETMSVPNDKFRMTFLDGCSETSYLEFGIVLRKGPKLTDEVYGDFAAPKNVNLTVKNVEPEIVKFTYNGTPHKSGDTVHVGNGVAAGFTMTVDDAAKIDLTNDTQRIVTVWRFEDDAGSSTYQYLTNAVGSTVTCTNVFYGGGSTQKLYVYAYDKDMDPETDAGETFEVTIAVDDSPFVYFTAEDKWLPEGSNRVDELTVLETDPVKKRYFWVYLSAPAGSKFTERDPLAVNLKVDKLGSTGVMNLSTTNVTFISGQKGGGTRFRVTLNDLDGGEQDDSLFQITATPTWKNSDRDTGYIGATMEVTVENVAPVITKPNDIDCNRTNSVVAGTSVQIPFKATDILADSNLSVTVVGPSNEDEYDYVSGVDTTYTYKFLDTDSGAQDIVITVTDKDGYPTSKTMHYVIPAFKTLRITPYGPAPVSLSRYNGVTTGLGKGIVWADGPRAITNAEHRVSYIYDEKTNQGEAYARGLAGNEAGGIEGYDSFFYSWIDLGLGSEGEGNDSQQTPRPTPTSTTVSPPFTVALDPFEAGKEAYDARAIEAIFSREKYPSDNMGDINADGIPDLYMQFPWQGGMLGGVFDDNLVRTGNDLAKTSGLNPDEDVIPAMDTSKYGTIIPDLADTWVTFGTPFDALTEIRGYHRGLNDAPQQTGIPNVKPDRVYEVDDGAGNMVWDEEKCTISYLEYLAWKDSGLPVDKWSPERPTDPTVADTDDDGMPDGYEYFFWYRAHVGYIDTDGTHKYLVGRRWNPTDPQHPDLIPPSEIEGIMDPLEPGDKATITYRDTDNDGLPDLIEFERGTNPFDYDTDGDGLPDGYEVYISETDPLDPTFGDALLNPDGDQMAFVLQEKWHLVGVLNAKGGVDYYVAPELSADGITNGFSTVDAGVTNSFTLVSAIGEDGETVKYVTTAPVQVYTDADGVIRLVGGLPAGKTWFLAKVGDQDVRGRATSLVKGATLAADPEDVELNVLNVASTPATYYKAWFYEQEKINGKLVDVFIRGAECGAKADLDPLAAEGLEVVDIRDDAHVALVHFYAYQEMGFDPRVAWKDPGAAISEAGTTRRYAHRDELYLLTFLYHANLLADGELTPTVQRPWTWIWETYATDPLSCDTDSDGAPDGWELYVFAGPKAYDGESGKLAIGYDWAYPRLLPGCAFSPIFPYDGEPNGENFKSDGDGLSEIQEFSAVESVAEYEGKPGAEAITLDDPEWTNKKWPTDPWNADTDNDGLSDAQEQGAFRHNGGLNPLSWDTDADGLPDPWELEFAGTATLGGAGTNAVAAAGGSTNATAAAWTWNDDGMDGTVNDAMKDYDHDGLRNWQEYMVGAMRCWRYDDITAPWTVNVGVDAIPNDGEGWYNVLLNPESPNFNPGLSDFILDPGLYFSCATNAYEQGGVFGKFYMLKDGYYHDLKIDAQTREDKMNRWVRNLADPILAGLMEGAYPTAYICCDPRLYDTDDDGMDDFYELFHGLNPLLGPEIDIVAQAWGYPEFPLCAVVNNWYEGEPMVPTRPDKDWRAKGPNDRDFFQLPWLAGLPDADPDGDNIRNQQEALFSNVQAASTYLHVDPTPLWMTDGQYEDSLTYRYYHISTPIWGALPKVWMPGKPYFEYNGRRYYWNDFPWIEYDEKTGICSMDYSINNWKVMDYMFSFEENEGYDSDHDYLSDFEEGQGKTKSASDPQVSDSPLRRQAMWFGGEADKGFLETALEVDELPPANAGAEEGQRFLYYTVECWAKPDESTYAKAGLQTLVERAIMSGPGNAGDETWLRKNFVLGIRDGRWYTRFDSTGTDANQPVEIAGGPAATTNWTHVAATYDGTALRLYVNGVCTPATTEYTSIQPEHGVNAIAVNDLSEYSGTVTVEFAGDRGLGVPQIAMLVGASAISELGVAFDYQWQTRNVLLFPNHPRGINTREQTMMGDYGNFFRGYIDEVRVWDGARKGADILADYEQRVRYDSAMALENREKVFKSWTKGGSRLDHAVEQLPPQLMYHWSFDHIAGAVDRADVMRVPAGFDTSWNVVDSMAIWSRPENWTSFWLDEGVNGSLWNGQVFSDHAWQPWVTDTISHLPRFDGTVLDSVYWSEDFTGARPVGGLGYTKLQFPRNAEVPSRWTQMLYADAGKVWAEDVRWEIIQATGDEELMQKYMFARRYLPTVGGDLMIFGSAYAKRISAAEGGMWDDQGPADAWAQTGSDADHNGLADWWEEYARENYGVDPFTPIDWTTTVNYEGRSMPAWEAYLRDLSRGLTVVNGAAKVRGEYADVRDIDMDGMPDWWEDLYHVDTQSTADTLADPDGDGLSNFAEYIISEKFGFARLNPLNPKTDGVCVDYFLRKGDLYLGEIFTDHDQVNDVWENKYADKADFYAYDPSRDDDGDGWSNWAEQKAGTDPRLVKETGIDDYTLAGFPVPCIRARIVNNGLTVETAPVVIKAWSERRDPGMTGDPDATWTVAGSAKDGQQQASGTNGDGTNAAAEMGESSKYLGIKPDGTRTLTLGPGAIERNSVKIFYKDLSFCKAQIVGDSIVPTEIGSELEAQWYYLVHDREGKLYTTGGIFADEQEVGTVDYDTGEVTIDFGNDALCGITLGDPDTTAADGETPTYDLLNLDQSYVLVTWNSSARSGSLNRTLYLSDADDPGDISGRFDHVREGLNSFIAFVDRDGDGAYTAGEPYGFVRGVDVGWSGAEFEIELTETSPVFARVNVFDGASDRLTLWGTSCGDTAGASGPTASNDTWGASANAYEHVRIVPYMVAGVLTDGEGTNSFVYAVDYVENRVVAEFDVRKDTKPYITEADFIRDGAFDIDWDEFSTSAFANNSRLTSAVGEVTAVKYRIVFGNEGPIGAASNLDVSSPGVSSFQTLIERRFERTAARTRPTELSVDGVVCGAQPLFGWRLDEPTDVQVYDNPNTGVTSYVEPAARYGCSYTAFEIQVADRDGNVVYDSGVVRAPVRGEDGFFRWTPTALYAGDQTALGKIFSATGNWQWRVAMYNSKFKPNVREAMNGWSAWQEFSTSVGTGNTLGDFAHETIDVSVKYTGPVKVLDGCEDLSTTKGTVRVQAFVSPDFSGEPVAQGFITNKTALTDVADAAANGRLIGLKSGDYYLRAYIDTNGNLKKDDWESWGAAAEPVNVGPGVKVPVISFFIEDADTDQDWIPDAWEMQVNESLDVDNVTVLPDGQIKFKLIYPETTRTTLKSAAAPVTFFQNLNAARMLLTSEADGGGDAVTEILAATQPKAVPGTVAITALALDADNGEAVLTVTGETEKSEAAEFLDAVYVFPDQPLTLNVYRKNSLVEKDWTLVKENVPVIIGSDTEAEVRVSLGDDLDMTQGFYMVEIKQ